MRIFPKLGICGQWSPIGQGVIADRPVSPAPARPVGLACCLVPRWCHCWFTPAAPRFPDSSTIGAPIGAPIGARPTCYRPRRGGWALSRLPPGLAGPRCLVLAWARRGGCPVRRSPPAGRSCLGSPREGRKGWAETPATEIQAGAAATQPRPRWGGSISTRLAPSLCPRCP